VGHEPKETLVATMSCHEILQALTNSYKKELPLPESSMGFGMGF